MAKKVLGFAVVVVLIAGVGAPTYAWNSFGHMAVAYVAYQKMTPQARTRVKALLAMNPKYNDWVAWVPPNTAPADKDMMVFMLAATWADRIKDKNSGYADEDPKNRFRPDGATSSRNIGYADMFRHQYWHFVDRPFAADGTALPAIPTPNVQERIALFRGVLASDDDDPLKSYDLTWLLHLVGDVHQPLHCATRVSSTDPNGDDGGTKVKVYCAGCAKELHAFWDDLFGTAANEQAALQPVIAAAKELPEADATLAAKSDEKEWVAEGFQAAQQTVYQPPIGAGDGPFSLTDAYESTARTLAKQRIALAGARLANLINNELK